MTVRAWSDLGQRHGPLAAHAGGKVGTGIAVGDRADAKRVQVRVILPHRGDENAADEWQLRVARDLDAPPDRRAYTGERSHRDHPVRFDTVREFLFAHLETFICPKIRARQTAVELHMLDSIQTHVRRRKPLEIVAFCT